MKVEEFFLEILVNIFSLLILLNNLDLYNIIILEFFINDQVGVDYFFINLILYPNFGNIDTNCANFDHTPCCY